MKDLLIFGNGKIADVIYYYAKNECNFNVVAFTCDKKYIKEVTFNGLPLIDFKNINEKYPAEKYAMFVAVGYHDLNDLRHKKLLEAKKKDYEIVSIISPKANLPKTVKVGENCFIMPPALIHPNVVIGNNTFVWSGAMIGHHSVIGENCWLTSCCNISGNVTTGNNNFFAVNATVGHSVTIGNNCFIGANTLVNKNLDDEKVVITEGSKPIRLNSSMFLRMSKFTNL